jgi:hypothetical protein
VPIFASEKQILALKNLLFFHPLNLLFFMQKEDKSKIKILHLQPLVSPELIAFLNRQFIDENVAKKHCEEVHFEVNNKRDKAIRFKNDTGGFSLQNTFFKGTVGVEFTTLICHTKSYNGLSVFEDFLDFLSYHTSLHKLNLLHKLSQSQPTFLILNDLSFFEISLPLMEWHKSVKLYVDASKATLNQAQRDILASKKYKDCSQIINGLKEYNKLSINKDLQQKPIKGLRMKL